MTQTIEQLTARVRELEEENARLKAESRDACLGLNDYYGRKLAAEQEEIEHLKQVQECHAIDLRERDASIKSHAEKNRELKAQLATAEQRVAEWQPISTAPKDAFVLLAGPSGYTTIKTVFTTGRMCSDYHKGRWIDHANDDLTDWGFEPTHWMPLPKAPSGASI